MSSTRPTTTPTVKTTASYNGDPHYQEAQRFGSRVAYIGSIQISPLKDMRADVMKNGDRSDAFGWFFCPERDNGKWTYEKNQAFMAGAIDVGRRFILVTDIIEGYKDKKAPDAGTVKELLWLKDNGYTFRPDPKNMQRTIIEAPVKLLANRTIDSYQDSDGLTIDDQRDTLIAKLREIKKEVLDKREQLLHNNESNRFQSSSSAAVSTGSLVPSSAPGKYIPPSQRGYTPGQPAVSRQSPLAATSSVSGTSSSTPTTNNLQPSRVVGPPPGFTTPGPNTSLDARAPLSTSSITARLTAASGSTIPRYVPPGRRPPVPLAQTLSASSVSATANTPTTISRGPIYVAPTPSAPSANPSTESTPSVTSTNTPNQPPPGLTRR